jgi:hypothetical protein
MRSVVDQKVVMWRMTIQQRTAPSKNQDFAAFTPPKFERPTRPRTQHDCHHDTKVKPEATTAVIELLMMGGKTPETC